MLSNVPGLGVVPTDGDVLSAIVSVFVFGGTFGFVLRWIFGRGLEPNQGPD